MKLCREDPVFSQTGEGARAYTNSLCTDYAYGVARLDSNVILMASRVAHELCHTMYINHVRGWWVKVEVKGQRAVVR